MKKLLKTLLIAGLTFGLWNCSSPHKRARGWSMNMRGMAESYEKLIPYLYDRQRYRNPKNEKFISLYLKNLSQNASDLDRHTGKGLSGDDPLFTIGLKGLKTMIQKASESYYVESYDYSQKLLQASVNYCNSCHTRTALGPTFIKWDQFESITENLNPVDHANILVATRQFPKAVSVLQEGFQKENIPKDQQDEALKKLMMVSLRNLQSPKKASEVLTALSPKTLSQRQQTEIKNWQKYLNKWQEQKVQPKAEQLMAGQNIAGDSYVEAVHNSLVLHKSLSTILEKAKRARIYYSLGKIYAKYTDLVSWNLPETYFETCIYEDPGSKQAMKCYYALESRLKEAPFDRTNSLITVEKANLKKLKILASKQENRPSSSAGGSGTEDL